MPRWPIYGRNFGSPIFGCHKISIRMTCQKMWYHRTTSCNGLPCTMAILGYHSIPVSPIFSHQLDSTPEQDLVCSPLLLDKGQYTTCDIMMIAYARELLVDIPNFLSRSVMSSCETSIFAWWISSHTIPVGAERHRQIQIHLGS